LCLTEGERYFLALFIEPISMTLLQFCKKILQLQYISYNVFLIRKIAMKKKLVILSLTIISINSLFSDLKSACCAEEEHSLTGSEECSLFDAFLEEERETELLTLLRLNYAETFLNQALSAREQQILMTAGIQFLKKTLDELAKKPNEHHAYLNRMFGKKETTENLIRLYQQLLKRELIRQTELQEAIEIEKATIEITQEEQMLAEEMKSKNIALDKRKAEIKAAVERARAETQKSSDYLPPKELNTRSTLVEKKDDTTTLLLALDTLANKFGIHTALDFCGSGFCPACGPHTEEPHISYRRNGQKISLKGIASLKDLDAFIKKDPRDSRRKIIAKTIRALGQKYFSDQKIRKDLETIFSHSWTH